MGLPKWERILAPTDLSPLSREAVAYAHALAERFGAELHVLHITADLDRLSAEHGATGIIPMAGERDDYDRWLAALIGEPGKVRRVEVIRLGTDVGESIIRYAHTQDIDLIVMARHGRSALTHLLLGSVAESVLRSSPCPVLTYRPSPAC